MPPSGGGLEAERRLPSLICWRLVTIQPPCRRGTKPLPKLMGDGGVAGVEPPQRGVPEACPKRAGGRGETSPLFNVLAVVLKQALCCGFGRGLI
jgi:hypothetical protein